MHCRHHSRSPVPIVPPIADSQGTMTQHIIQVRGHADVRHRINVVALGIPLVDEEVVDPFLGRPRHVCIFEIQRSSKARFEAVRVPYCLARVTYSRGKRHGEAHHRKAMDARRGARKNKHASIVLRWQNDKMYRESQKVHGWTEDYCRYLDYLTTIDISFSATWHQRNRYENTISLVSDDRQAGPMRARKVFFESTTQTLTDPRREPGRQMR